MSYDISFASVTFFLDFHVMFQNTSGRPISVSYTNSEGEHVVEHLMDDRVSEEPGILTVMVLSGVSFYEHYRSAYCIRTGSNIARLVGDCFGIFNFRRLQRASRVTLQRNWY